MTAAIRIKRKPARESTEGESTAFVDRVAPIFLVATTGSRCMMAVGIVKKSVAFPQGTQRIARIGEPSEPNAYVGAGITDAELASAFVGQADAPIAVRRAKNVTSAYSPTVLDERSTLTIA
jgi:hypothetical protein